MRLTIVTSGGAGMYCGSCMHDNTLARGLIRAGCDVLLMPTYTPIRVDEEDLSSRKVFLGGINLYLASKSRFWRAMPRFLTSWMNHPAVIRFATRFSVSNDARQLGELTMAMLAGVEGPQKKEVEEFVDFVSTDPRDAVCFSNALLSGVVPSLRKKYSGTILCTLQGDDIFLDGLVPPYQSMVLERLKELVKLYDGFLVHSKFYRDKMSRLLEIPQDKFHLIPLGIDLEGHLGKPKPRGKPFRIGYFARVCPEKGLHLLVEAFRRFHKIVPESVLLAGGYLGPRDSDYFKILSQETRDLGEAFRYIGSPDRAEKVAFLQSLDLLSVPTVYQEPKGLFVLEALANGVPVVQPRHGAFPEVLEATGGGLLFPPNDPQALAESLLSVHSQPDLMGKLARTGHEQVHQRFGLDATSRATLEILKQISVRP